MDLLTLAFYLSVLSYCLGLALRALPVPFFTIKKLGRSLVVEGVFSCILTFSYRVLLYLIDFFGSLLESNWPLYSTWLTERISILLTLIAISKAIGVLLSKIGLGFFAQSFISQLTGLMTTSLTTLIATSIISTIIYSSAAFLIALGIVLHAVPFKLTRSIGATLIAITMVFSIGMPLMPSFIGTFSNVSGSLITSGNVCTATMTLVDATNAPFGQAVIEGYIEGKLVYKYKFDDKGVLVVDKTQGFPCTDHVARIDIAGNKYVVMLSKAPGTDWSVRVSIPNMLAIVTNHFVFFDDSIMVEEVVKSENSIALTLSTSSPAYFKLYVEAGDEVRVYIDGDANTTLDSVETFEWYGVNYAVYTYTLAPGRHSLEIRLDHYVTTSLNVDVHPYIISALGIDLLAPENMLFYVVQLFIELTVLPLVYVAMLVTITLNVARLLGGVSTSIARIVVNY